MNLFEILNTNHKVREAVTPGLLNEWLKSSDVLRPIKMSYDELFISNPQVAALLAYVGNTNNCLSDADYQQFQSLLGSARISLMASFKPGPLTKTITSHVLKHS